MSGVNVSETDAQQLADVTRGLPIKLDLIDVTIRRAASNLHRERNWIHSAMRRAKLAGCPWFGVTAVVRISMLLVACWQVWLDEFEGNETARPARNEAEHPEPGNSGGAP